MGLLTRIDKAIDAFNQKEDSQKSMADDNKAIMADDQKGYQGNPLSIWDNIGGKTGKIRNEKDELKAYDGQLPWASIAVDCVTRDVASQEYFFCDSNGQIVEDRRLPEEMILPFRLGYGGLSFKQILQIIVPHRLLAGNSILWKTSSTTYGRKNGVIDSFLPLAPSQVRACTSYGGLILDGYKVTVNGTTFELEPNEVIHIRQNMIFNPFWGVGNIAKVRLIAEGDAAASEYINSFLEDASGLPQLTVTESTQRKTEDIMRLGELLKSKYSKKIMYMAGEGVSITQSNLLQKDMEFLAIREFDRQTILSIFGVHPMVAGIPEGSNKATSGNQRLAYLSSTINPLLCSIEDDFNSQHVHKFDKNIFFRFKKHATGEVDDAIKKMLNGIITPNRASELVGEEFDLNDESRNKLYFPMSVAPIDYVAEPAEQQAPDAQQGQTQSETQNNSDSEDSETDKSTGLHLTTKHIDEICNHFTKSTPKSKQFQVQYLRASLKSRATMEDKYTGKLSEFFEGQKKRILAKLKATEKSFGTKAPSANVIFDLEEEDALLQDELKGLHTSGIQRAISDVNKIADSRVNFSTSNPFVKIALSKLGERITGTTDRNGNKIGIGANTLLELKLILLDAVNESWNINQIQDAIQEKFDQFQGYRARMIARTESRAAWDVGAKVAYQELGVKTVDVVGCTQFEPDSDCGAKNVPIEQADNLSFHPNHIGSIAPNADPRPS